MRARNPSRKQKWEEVFWRRKEKGYFLQDVLFFSTGHSPVLTPQRCIFKIQEFINMQKHWGEQPTWEDQTDKSLPSDTYLSRAFLLVGTRPSHSKVRPSGDQLCGLWWRPMYCWFPERWWVLVSVPDIFCDVAPFLFLIWSRCLVLLCTTVLKT